MLFKELADRWIAEFKQRVELGLKKPASLEAFSSRVKHILPMLGELPVEEVRNGKVRELAETLIKTLGPKSVREVVAVVKSVLESYVDQDGEPLLESKWNPKFILKVIKPVGVQRQPIMDQNALNAILKNRTIKVRDRVLIALVAATGLRRGELLALRINGPTDATSWDSATSAIQIRQSVWRAQLQRPKTKSAVRQIDVSPKVNEMLIEFTKGRLSGEFLFRTKSGKPPSTGFIHDRIMRPNHIPGVHSLRRFRASHCDKHGCPRTLLSGWLGHSTDGTMTGVYVKLHDNDYRKMWAEKIGTGLDLAAATLPVLSKSKTAKPRKPRKTATADAPAEQMSEPLTQLAAF